jgi:hypothetical protein
MSESVQLTTEIFNGCLKLVYENDANGFMDTLESYPGLITMINDAWGLIHFLYDFSWDEGIHIYLEKGGRLDVLTKDYYVRMNKIPLTNCGGQTILHIVAKHCRTDPDRLASLIDAFPHLNVQDWNGNLPEDIRNEPEGSQAGAVAYWSRQNGLIARRLAMDLSEVEALQVDWIESDFLEPFETKADTTQDEKDQDIGASCGCSKVVRMPRREGDIKTFFISEELRADILRQIEVLPERPPNSMHRYGKIVLPAMESTVLRIVKSLLDVESAQRILRLHAFYIKYDLAVQTKLGLHMDDSTYTINVCLSNDSTGAELVFDEIGSYYPHTTNRGIIHRGYLKHHVEHLKSGVRESFIIWVTLI